MSIRVLIIEDERLIRWSLRETLEQRGYQVTEADTGAAAMQALESNGYDLVILDHKLPDTTGMIILRALHDREYDGVVIMMTAFGTIERAVEAMKLGAFDYLPKPFEVDELLFAVDKGLETTRLRRQVRALRRELETAQGAYGIIGRHPEMVRVLEFIRRVADSGTSTVLIRGDTGTGKDMVARAIHATSRRSLRPFVNVTCTALSETLLESELFGHERGAFTDAKTQKKGLFELADSGVVFLDEIGDMPPSLQAKLLRFLEARRFRRVGGTREIQVDVRVIAATNRPIEQAIEQGAFREDLFYRLNVLTIELPRLRDRGDDLALLAQHFVTTYAREFKKPAPVLAPAALKKLGGYDWPGNVRELRNVIERAVLLCDGDEIDEHGISFGRATPHRALADVQQFSIPPDGFDLSQLERLERHILHQAMERSGGNQVHAAKLLHVSRDLLRYRLRKHKLV